MASETEVRAALAWETDTQPPADKSTWEWLWEAIQGDFNDNRSTGQIAFDAAVSMIPVVDQICDVRDIIANCKGIAQSDEKEDNTWKWVALALTLIGLFPTLGSLLKGVLKIFFTFIRRAGLDKLIKAADDAMTWVITFLRKREVQDYLRLKKVDEVFKWLADAARQVRGKVNTRELLAAFDKGIGIMKGLLNKVTWLPGIGSRAKQAMEVVDKVRRMADAQLGKALAPVQRALDQIIRRLDMEHLVQRSGIVNASNVHFRGTLPEARAVTLMREAEPPPSWLSKGKKGKYPAQDLQDGRDLLAKHPDWPRPQKLEDQERMIKSFHTMEAVEIKGPARLYRVTSPGNGAMGDCWVPEDVWNKIIASPDPKAAWRKYSAVWPDWNPDGQFVVLDIKRGESLKAWRGPTSSQVKPKASNLDAHLEGGWDQVIIEQKITQLDTTRYYMRGGGHGETLHPPGLSRDEWKNLSESKKRAYTPIREEINHPDISGPFDTGWGPTDFDAQIRDAKIGLPTLPGQVTNLKTP
ncbi:MAG: hypothetical protein LBE62_11910 [Azonexus sp.]|jgi:hypothetical protein|nr:hypothetical protein [Azonexus sp.]